MLSLGRWEATMIKVLMFDLGDTLVDARHRPYPGVPAALAALAALKTAADRPLRACLVSDYPPATPPVTAAKVSALFARFLKMLDDTGLRPAFEPVGKRVTLSTHAGAYKPDAAVFERAIRRLGVAATLAECLLITGNAAHVGAARGALGMHALHFQPPGSTDGGDFDDWAEAPALIAHEVAPGHAENLHAVVAHHLSASGIEVASIAEADDGRGIEAHGHVWCPVDVTGCADLAGLHVAVPVTRELRRTRRGTLLPDDGAAAAAAPSAEARAESTAFVESLAAHGQIGGRTAGAPAAVKPTHRIEVAADGTRRLVRSSDSAA
jgi:FMN phosphatase YigB (HAD superfamily)